MPRGIPNNPKKAKKPGPKPSSKKLTAPAPKPSPKPHEYYIVVGNDCGNGDAFHTSVDIRVNGSKWSEVGHHYAREESANVYGPFMAFTPEEALDQSEKWYNSSNDGVSVNDLEVVTVINMTLGTVAKYKVDNTVVLTPYVSP